MGSPCEVLIGSDDQSLCETVVNAVAAEAWRIEEKFSRYIGGNVVDKINTADNWPIEVDEETANLINFSSTLNKISSGAFDITSGILREAWSFDGSDNVPTASEVQHLLTRVGWDKVAWHSPLISLRNGMQIDLGGVGKEYAVDRAATIALTLTNQPCLVNFGGDVRAIQSGDDDFGWQVGIESLQNSQMAQKTIRLSHGGLATSGDSHRYLFKDGVRYSHVLDPKTGWPIVDAPRSITVAADTCTQAGMLATLAMLKGTGAEAFLDQENAQYWCYR